MKKCAIMQPTYNPWLGYFDMMDYVDVFVYLDDVQLVKRSWQVRNRIKTPQGELFLTIPIKKTAPREETLIKDALINDGEKWRIKHLKAIIFSYKKASYFDVVFPFVESLINAPFQHLGDFNINFIENVRKRIGIRTKTIRSSSLNIVGRKDEKLAKICKALNCDFYLSPQGSAVYIEKEKPGGKLVENGIEVYYHNYEHPTYRQLHGDFLPYIGIIDLLFNEGFERALEIIRKGRRPPIHYLEFRRISGFD
jgi:hypothetical protein